MTYSIAMRHFAALVICAGLAGFAVGAVPYFVNAVIASAMLTKPPTPPSAAALAAANCHFNQSAAAVFVPLVLAWVVRVVSLGGEIWWMRLLRASLEMNLLVVAGWLLHFAYTTAHPLMPLFVERCGPVRFLMK